MVRDDVWAAAGGECHLCVGCLATRLGRWLTVQDFTDCGLNTDPSELRSGCLAAWAPTGVRDLADRRRDAPRYCGFR
jgi:hypothetical protein